MKLRYYMRGLGIGIAVTAFIMNISAGQGKSLSDEEIKARAMELGMVESTVLSSMQHLDRDKEENTPKTENLPQETVPNLESTPKETTPSLENIPKDTVSTVEDIPEETIPSTADIPSETTLPASDNAQEKQESEDKEANKEMVTVEVKRGESSVSVSKSLAAAGLIEDAASYDKYLCANGYDKSIAVGTYKIPSGSTEEDIAKVITKKLSFE